MPSGVDVTRLERSEILSTAASWVDLAADDVEFHETAEEAFGVVIYVTPDKKKREISGDGIVMFADEETEPVITGQHAELEGTWLFPVPEGGLFIDKARLQYIRVKER